MILEDIVIWHKDLVLGCDCAGTVALGWIWRLRDTLIAPGHRFIRRYKAWSVFCSHRGIPQRVFT